MLCPVNHAQRWWSVKELTDAGWSAARIAAKLGISESTVGRDRADIREVEAGRTTAPGVWRDAKNWIGEKDWELVKAAKMRVEEGQERWRRKHQRRR